jgi:hypothetical protein
MQSTNNKTIHCKVTFNDQIRRFEFKGTEFTQLRNHVSSLIGLPSDGFVLQYVDDESDLINLSSNEDFGIAVDVSGGLIRLIATAGSTPSTGSVVTRRQYCRKQYQGYGKGGKGERLSHEERHQKKLELLKKFLSEMPQDNALTPQQVNRKNHLRNKIEKAESRLSNWQEREKKRHSDKRKRWEKKEHKKDRKSSNQFPPEVEQQIKDLKSQINSLKPAARELRNQKKQKKSELETCLQTGTGDKEAILQEIVEIKEKIGQLNAQMKPVRDNIRTLKGKQ